MSEHRIITAGHEEWPEAFAEMPEGMRPQRLYVAGLPLEAGPRTIAVVGARRATIAGLEATEELVRGLVEAGFGIVSGLAVGVDAAAHRAALEAGGYTIAVLGCGIDVNYPAANRRLKDEIAERGTLVTEYEEGVQPVAHHFPHRNRIVAGLAHGTIVVEGGLQSGALITARIALDLNRHVFAVPGSVRNALAAGPNELIRASQAALVTEVRHVFEDIAPETAWEGPVQPDLLAPEVNLADDEARIVALLDDVPAPPARLAAAADLKTGAVALALSRLEIRGLALRRPAGYAISTSGARVRRGMLSPK